MDLLGIRNCVLCCIVLCWSFTCQHQQKSTALLFVCSVDVIHHNFWRELKTMKSCYPLTKISKYMWNNHVMDRIPWNPQWKHSNSIAWLLFEIPMLPKNTHTNATHVRMTFFGESFGVFFFSLGLTFWWYISEYKYLPSIFLAINKSNVDIKTIKWMKIVSDVGWNNYFNGFSGWLCFLTQPFNMSALSPSIHPFIHTFQSFEFHPHSEFLWMVWPLRLYKHTYLIQSLLICFVRMKI